MPIGAAPARMLSPVLEEVANEQADVKVVKVDVDANPGLAQKYGVMSIPTVYYFMNGKEAGKFIGARGKNEVLQNDQIKQKQKRQDTLTDAYPFLYGKTRLNAPFQACIIRQASCQPFTINCIIKQILFWSYPWKIILTTIFLRHPNLKDLLSKSASKFAMRDAFRFKSG